MPNPLNLLQVAEVCLVEEHQLHNQLLVAVFLEEVHKLNNQLLVDGYLEEVLQLHQVHLEHSQQQVWEVVYLEHLLPQLGALC